MREPFPFKWRHFQAEIILVGVRCYLRDALRSRDREEMMRERGLSVDHTTLFRWVQRDTPQRQKRCRPRLNAWSVDETSITSKKGWVYL